MEYNYLFHLAYIDLIEAETAKLIPEHLVSYKCFGEPGGPHYAHYDLVGGRLVLFSSLPPSIHYHGLFIADSSYI